MNDFHSEEPSFYIQFFVAQLFCNSSNILSIIYNLSCQFGCFSHSEFLIKIYEIAKWIWKEHVTRGSHMWRIHWLAAIITIKSFPLNQRHFMEDGRVIKTLLMNYQINSVTIDQWEERIRYKFHKTFSLIISNKFFSFYGIISKN